ncbi:MAG: large conductance mechanosensitive channel protein MscL [Bacilli bacterium]|nr:large conductance mechanosensitive channel protein MscL [Bacilli bacterium]
MIGEFKEFISHGNVLDLAVGVIIGGAFQSIVSSLTNNLISPILGCFTEADFTAYSLKIGNLNLKYGAFLTDVINFLIMAFVVFLIVKFMNKLIAKDKKEEEVIEEKVDEEVLLLKEIRDLLKNSNKK